MLTFLVKCSNADVNRSTVSGQTPLDMVHSPEHIRLLLKNGATPTYAHYKEYFPSHLQRDPADMSVKIFVLGNHGAGKSTLVKSLKTETEGLSRFVNRFTKSKDVGEKTAGIIPHDTNSKTLGPVTLFDFAGHEEYYAGHDVLLHNSMANSPSIILLVVDMRDKDSKFREVLLYWLDFINNQISEKCFKPHLIIVGSHRDKSKHVKTKSQFMMSFVESFKLEGYVFVGQVVLDCRLAASSSMSDLRSLLSQSCQALRSTEHMAIESHCFLVFLLDKFRDEPAIRVGTAEAKITEVSKSEVYLKFLKSHNFLDICETLNRRGNILFMKSPTHVMDSWIILDKAILLSEVNGVVFAPEGFKEYRKVATSTGVVPLSRLDALFPNLNSDMIAQFLCHLEFCQEITDVNLLTLLSADNTISPSPKSIREERFLFFPGLVHLDRPPELWQPNSDLGYHSGWLLQCSNPQQNFSLRFLQVLMLRLAFQFAFASSEPSSPALQRKCYLWDKGISWANSYGGEALVEISDQKRLVVLSRCKQGKLASVQLRSAIIQKVLNTKDELCPKVTVHESFILPSDTLCYPLDVANVTAVSITDVAQTVKEGGRFVVLEKNQTLELEKLLHFEPYAMLGERILWELFDDDKPEYDQEVTDELIKCITDKIYKTTNSFIIELYETLLDQVAPQGSGESTNCLARAFRVWREERGAAGTIGNLRKKLDEFSVFAGRDPLHLVAGMSVCLDMQWWFVSTVNTLQAQAAI